MFNFNFLKHPSWWFVYSQLQIVRNWWALFLLLDLEFDWLYLLSMWNASAHSLLILLRRAELELVLKRPSDLLRKPNEVFWLVRRGGESWALTELETIIHRTTDGAHIAGLLGNTLGIRERMKPQQWKSSESTFLVTLSSIRCLTLFFTFRMSFSFSSCTLIIPPSFIGTCLQTSEIFMLKFLHSLVILLTLCEIQF